MKLSDFDYDLPPRLIAQFPAPERSASRLLHLDGGTGALRDLLFRGVIDLVGAHDVLVLNDTRVIKARLFGRRRTGGRIEVLVERVLSANEAEVQMRVSHPPHEGERITLADAVEATVLGRRGGFFRLRFEACDDLFDVLDRHGDVPLPPYIEHRPDTGDEARYQTVYARERGAVAAPTAGLHFDERVLDRLRGKGVTVCYVTLHVGAGTFQPVRHDDVSRHEMHGEWYNVPQATIEAIAEAKVRGGRVVAAGTTTLRALETVAADSACFDGRGATPAVDGCRGETKLFIVPGYRFRVVERLITNFHLPKSTLLMLVSAFGGIENLRRAYRHAIDQAYRFYSYGDAMLIERAPQ